MFAAGAPPPELAGAPAAPGPIYEGRTDADGDFRSGRLAAGIYALEVALPDGGEVRRLVGVADEAESAVELALSRLHVQGTVWRGEAPAAGIRVTATTVPAGSHVSVPDFEGVKGSATTREDGTYELALWSPDDYLFHLYEPTGTPAALFRRVTVERDGETVDFHLQDGSLRGVVTDEEGQPLAMARVVLAWNDTVHRVAVTDSAGQFEFATEGSGSGRITAYKDGYRHASQEVALSSGAGGGPHGDDADGTGDAAAPPPVVLKLQRADTVQGTLRTAGGEPAAGAWVALGPVSFGNGAVVLSTSLTDGGGTFSVDQSAGASMHGFFTGPGCPLFAANVVPAGDAPLFLTCPDLPAAIEITFQDAQGRPVAHQGVLLRQGGVPIPGEVLAAHLALLGLPAESDGTGRLTLAGLAPGTYDVFGADAASESTVEAGSQRGFLTSVELAPLATAEIAVTPPSSE